MIVKRNLKRSINLTYYNTDVGGAFSSYYKYNDTQGIKVIYSTGYKTIKQLRKSKYWRLATLENTLLKKCGQRYKNIPKTYGVFPIRVNNKFYPGIVMQHIKGYTLDKSCMTEEEKWKLKNDLLNSLKRKGIIHHDLHYNNVMVCSDTHTYYVIDFTVGLITLDGHCHEYTYAGSF